MGDRASSGSAGSTAPTAEGLQLLQDPLLNRGTAFTDAERDQHGLRGLLPPQVETFEQQADRAWRSVQAVEGTSSTSRQLAQHITLRQLQDTNEVLFYEVLSRHVEEALPLVYTPTVGAACQRFSQIYRRPRGLFVSYPDRHRLREVLRNRPRAEVDVIVVTDGQRILGLGDQGVGGMGIPIGKLSLYTAIGGIDPARTLPIVLDVGCDDDDLRDDPFYLGWRHPRVTGAEYEEFVDAFVTAVREELPGVLLQWEDFASKNALPILERYRDQLLTFNDDIQGTAAVVAGAMTGAASVSGTPLRDQRVVVVGAGSAGIGVCDRLVQAMVADGAEEADAVAAVHVLDVGGLLVEGQSGLTDAQARYAKSREQLSGWGVDVEHRSELDLLTVVRNVRPTALIGLSAAHGIFTRQVVTEMASHVERPIVFPLSNPTSHAEATPQDLSDWTDGRALVATGSPFPPVERDGAERRVAQCNNVYVFPAVGLGVVASRATRVTDAMLLQAALALGEQSPVKDDPDGALLPEVADMPTAALAIAEAVARQAVADGVAPQASDEELAEAVRAARWTPAYR